MEVLLNIVLNSVKYDKSFVNKLNGFITIVKSKIRRDEETFATNILPTFLCLLLA